MKNYLTDLEKSLFVKMLYGKAAKSTKTKTKKYYTGKGYGRRDVFDKKMSKAQPRVFFSIEENDAMLEYLTEELPNSTVCSTFTQLFEGKDPAAYGYETTTLITPIAAAMPVVETATTTKSAIAEYEPKFEGTRNLQRKMAEVKASSW